MQGSKVFCLQYVSMATIDIPQGGSMAKYLECNDVKAAYQVACLGVTEADWKALAQAALQVRTMPQCDRVQQRQGTADNLSGNGVACSGAGWSGALQ